MEVIFTPEAKQDMDFWAKTGNKKNLKKISQLIRAIIENPYEGIGKPEALKHKLSGFWSRRINLEDRIVYQIKENALYIYGAKGHYE